MSDQELWVAGRYIEGAMILLGIFECKECAITRCVQKHDFVGPIVVNKFYREEPEPWHGSFYPLLQRDPEIAQERGNGS